MPKERGEAKGLGLNTMLIIILYTEILFNESEGQPASQPVAAESETKKPHNGKNVCCCWLYLRVRIYIKVSIKGLKYVHWHLTQQRHTINTATWREYRLNFSHFCAVAPAKKAEKSSIPSNRICDADDVDG